MLTRLQVRGFKSLWDVDVKFGPFTCIAGPNAVGKSNLFDAIQFLSRLATDNFLDAALSIRGARGLTGNIRDGRSLSGNIRDLFHRWRDQHETRIFFLAEMLVPCEGIDSLGQKAEASITSVRYELEIEYSDSGGISGLGTIRLVSEKLIPIKKGEAARMIRFKHSPSEWRDHVIVGPGRRSPFISTDGKLIRLHQEGNQGRPRSFNIADLPRTVLSTVNATESPTSLLVKKEMESWRLLQLEPSALRNPDSFLTPPGLQSDGGHLPATLYALAHKKPSKKEEGAAGHGANKSFGSGTEVATTITGATDKVSLSPESVLKLQKTTDNGTNSIVYEQIAGRLSGLIDDVKSILIDRDDKYECFILALQNYDGTRYEARSLSDGTLRFLALATLAEDPSALGVICMEEPENGIQPSRIPAILKLLKAIACDPTIEVGEDNPLRQVIINTHSPSVVKLIDPDDLLIAVYEQQVVNHRRFNATVFKWLSKTWRAKSDDRQISPIAIGKLMSYLEQVPLEDADEQDPQISQKRRLIDREDIKQMILPLSAD